MESPSVLIKEVRKKVNNTPHIFYMSDYNTCIQKTQLKQSENGTIVEKTVVDKAAGYFIMEACI